MKYKNIVFDFGNVLATFQYKPILEKCGLKEDDMDILTKAFFHNWDSIDAGTTEYNKYMDDAKKMVPERLVPVVETLAENWHTYMDPLTDTWDLIHDLKKKGYKLYILSNAPTFFAEHASYFEITKEFDGIIFSAPLKMAKPGPDIYNYLLKTYNLNPKECLFTDDRISNIEAGRQLGMDGIIFKDDTVKELRELLL